MPIAIGSMSSSASMASSSATPLVKRLQKQRQEYADRRGEAEALQGELRRHAAEVQSKQGWDAETEKGVAEWIDDLGNIWRVLRVSLIRTQRPQPNADLAETRIRPCQSPRDPSCLAIAPRRAGPTPPYPASEPRLSNGSAVHTARIHIHRPFRPPDPLIQPTRHRA